MGNDIQLGLKQNWKQFVLLLIINAFVGGMVGMERTIFPKYAEEIFQITSKTALLSFIAAFGLSKAIANYFTGKLANRFGRKNLLVFGWILALPIPFLLISAQAWWVVVFANVLLGISQGFTWSSTVVMKIDLVGEKDRGFAMGLNEFSGYFAVGFIAFLSGYLATVYGIRPYPFYLGIILSTVGFLLSWFWVKDTRLFVHKETKSSQQKSMNSVFWDTTFKNKSLSSITQAGLVNNLNDGMMWGLFPVLLVQYLFSDQDISILAAIYPAVWGIGQLFTGRLSDIYSKKKLLFGGMLVQGLAISLLVKVEGFYMLAFLASILGLGTAMVYPTFLNAIAFHTTPLQRAETIGIFRLWRDLGYVFGALISGIIADLFGLEMAIYLVGGITILSAIILQLRMPKDNESHDNG